MNLHKQIISIILKSNNSLKDLYFIDNWIPHSTLGTDIKGARLGKCCEELENIYLPINALANSIVYIKYPDFEIIKKWYLN